MLTENPTHVTISVLDKHICLYSVVFFGGKKIIFDSIYANIS